MRALPAAPPGAAGSARVLFAAPTPSARASSLAGSAPSGTDRRPGRSPRFGGCRHRIRPIGRPAGWSRPGPCAVAPTLAGVSSRGSLRRFFPGYVLFYSALLNSVALGGSTAPRGWIPPPWPALRWLPALRGLPALRWFRLSFSGFRCGRFLCLFAAVYLRLGLDVDLESGEAGCEARVLSFLADGEAELIIGNDDECGLVRLGAHLFDLRRRRARWRRSLRDCRST